jgi:hypothetical protein
MPEEFSAVSAQGPRGRLEKKHADPHRADPKDACKDVDDSQNYGNDFHSRGGGGLA